MDLAAHGVDQRRGAVVGRLDALPEQLVREEGAEHDRAGGEPGQLRELVEEGQPAHRRAAAHGQAGAAHGQRLDEQERIDGDDLLLLGLDDGLGAGGELGGHPGHDGREVALCRRERAVVVDVVCGQARARVEPRATYRAAEREDEAERERRAAHADLSAAQSHHVSAEMEAGVGALCLPRCEDTIIDL